MSRREWPLRLVCGHDGCRETANYSYQSKRDLMESFELKHGSNGRWRCVRHARPEEVIGLDNLETSAVLTVEQKPHGKYFGNSGFVSGPGFKVFANDLPVGSRVVVSAMLILPSPTLSADSAAAAFPDSDGIRLISGGLCSDCPPVGYPTDETRCSECPRLPPSPTFSANTTSGDSL